MGKRYGSVLGMVQDTGSAGLAEDVYDALRHRAVARALFVLRTREQVTQTELARRMGRRQGHVSRMEHATNDEIRLGDVEQFLAGLGYCVELRAARRDRAVDRIKCSVLEVKAELDHLAELARNDAAIRNGVARLHSEYIANVVGLFADSVKRLITSEPVTAEDHQRIVSGVFECTQKLLEDSGALIPEGVGAGRQGIAVSTPGDLFRPGSASGATSARQEDPTVPA